MGQPPTNLFSLDESGPASRSAPLAAHEIPIDRPAAAAKLLRIAVIDIGSNSIRLMIADAWPTWREPSALASTHSLAATSGDAKPQAVPKDHATDSTESASSAPAPRERRPIFDYHVVAEERATTRLATGLDSTGKLDSAAMEQSAAAIASMVKLAGTFGIAPDQVRAVATSAVREASNRREFAQLVRRWSGVSIKIISAKREAKLAFSSIASSTLNAAAAGAEPKSGPPATAASALTGPLGPSVLAGAAIIDIGGGSTEIILTGRRKRTGRMKRMFLLRTGAVRITERFGGPAICAADRFAELNAFLAKAMSKGVWELDHRPALLIGVGGTVLSLAGMLVAAGIVEKPTSISGGRGRFGKMHYARITFRQLESALEHLRSMDLAERQLVDGLGKQRADVIIGGLAILFAAMQRLGKPTLLVHGGGIRDGLILRAARREWLRQQ